MTHPSGASDSQGVEEARSYAFRVSLFYAAVFLIYGFNVPYLPLWLGWRGLSDAEIAIVTAAPFFLRLAFTPVVAVAADRAGRHSRFIAVLAIAGLAAALVLSGVQGFWPILLASLVFALTTMTIMPLTETVAIGGVRAFGLDYGRMRLWGSMTFIAIGAAGGALVTSTGAWVILPVLVAAAAVTAVAAFMLPRPPQRDITQTAGTHFSWRDVYQLVRSPLFLVFLFATGAVQGAHAMFYTFGALHWSAQGISPAWAGSLWAVAVSAEVLLFAYSASVLRVMGPLQLLLAGAASAVVRWLAMSFDPPLGLLFPLQLLHAFTYGATHLAAIHFIHRAIPPAAAGTAQSLYATVAAGLMMGAATLASGPLYGAAAGLAYLAPSALALTGFIAGFVIYRSWDGNPLWAGSPMEPAPAASPTVPAEGVQSGQP